MSVHDALVRDPRVVPADAAARDVAELLTHPHVRSALVVDGDRLVGCITARSFVVAAARGEEVQSLRAGDLADGEVTTISPDASLDEALRLMVERDLERLAVTEDGRFLGVIPREPLLRRLAEDEAPRDGDAAALQ